MKFALEPVVIPTRKCKRCARVLPEAEFLTVRRTLAKECTPCRVRYSKPAEQRGPLPWRLATPANEPLRVRFTRVSGNIKTGPIPVSTSSPSTCPPSCSWFGRGCYAEAHYVGARWRRVPIEGMTWRLFCTEISRLPPGQLWRHNEAGDLPGRGDAIDDVLLGELVEANEGRRGFTFTHKHGLAKPHAHASTNRSLIEQANARGFVVNLSLDSFAEVDAARAFGYRAPLTVVVPSDAPQRQRTPGGAHVIVCPAQVKEGVQCATCGLCAVAHRKSVVAFRAHGAGAAIVSRNSTNLRLPLVR